MTNKENNFEKDINVPSKEQIMIDGVDVNKCKYLNTFSDCDGYHYYCDLADYIVNEYCEYYKDCNFKQLARKTQECEIWKNQVLILDEEDVTVQVTQEQFEEYKQLKQKCKQLKEDYEELNKRHNEAFQDFERIKQKYEALELENQEGYEIVDELKQECEELKERASIAEDNFACEVQARLYHQNEWLKFSKECEELKKQLKTSEKWRVKSESLNEKLDIENTRYRKALEEIENFMNYEFSGQNEWVKTRILDIINKAKGEGNEDT